MKQPRRPDKQAGGEGIRNCNYGVVIFYVPLTVYGRQEGDSVSSCIIGYMGV